MSTVPPQPGRLRAWLATWLDHPPFRRLVVVQVAHGAGDALVAIALASTLFFSVPLGEAREKVGLWLLVAMTPYALLSPVVGPLLDRWRDSYRIAVIVAAGGRALLGFLMATRTDRLWLYPLAFAVLVLSRAHAVSRAALVPSVAPPDRTLLWTNGRLAVAALVGGAVAALPGVGLQAWIGPGIVLRLAGVAFVVAAMAAAGIARGVRPERRPVRKGEHRALPRAIAAAAFGTAALRGAVGFLTFFLAFALRATGHGSGAFVPLLVMAGLGGAAGSALAPMLRRLAGLGVLVSALVVLAVAAGLSASVFAVPSAAVVAGVGAASAAAGRLAFDSLLQSDVEERVRGRAFARYETLFQLLWVGGAGLATAVPFGTGPGMRVVTVICLAGAVGAVAGRYGHSS